MPSHPPPRAPCDSAPGRLVPVIDLHRCEGKEDCVRVCPYGVFVVERVPLELRRQLGPFTRFKLFVHGNRQALVVHPEACRACGLCVQACPERAIQLRSPERLSARSPGGAAAE